MDTVAVQMACMVSLRLFLHSVRRLCSANTHPFKQADLGRQRQDELPLSNKERKGPSFAPSKRNGTGHIAPALKQGLETKWQGKFSLLVSCAF